MHALDLSHRTSRGWHLSPPKTHPASLLPGSPNPVSHFVEQFEDDNGNLLSLIEVMRQSRAVRIAFVGSSKAVRVDGAIVLAVRPAVDDRTPRRSDGATNAPAMQRHRQSFCI